MRQKIKHSIHPYQREMLKNIKTKISILIISVRLNSSVLANTNPGIHIIIINPRQRDRVTHVSMASLPTLSSLLGQMQGLLPFVRAQSE